MILWFYTFGELDFDALAALYEEELRTAGEKQYRNASSWEQLLLAQSDFAAYLTDTFFCQQQTAYCVLKEDGKYLCAARVEPYADGYLLTGLTTRPGFRGAGNGKKLLTALLEHCTQTGMLPIYSHVANKNLPSAHLHLSCGFRVYKESARFLDGTVSAESKTYIYEK